MTKSIYTSGEYLIKNPTWDVEDSAWKAAQVLKMFERNKLRLKTIAEIGCGAGEILNQLHMRLGSDVTFNGFEISPQAYAICKEKTKSRLRYSMEDFFNEDSRKYYDLVLAIDVFEHVEDYLGFLRRLKQKGTFKIFHIPLELSASTVLRTRSIAGSLERVGHLHYFNKQIALQSLGYAGYEILDYFYTAGALELPAKRIQTNLMNVFRRFFAAINEDMTVRCLGGYSLLVLTK